jgi:FtsP/CotA-like multicopper oxidase with cupredoxin domain
MKSRWTRREVLGVAGAAAMANVPVFAAGRSEQGPGWNRLRIPQTTPPDTALLECAPAQVDMGDGLLRGVWAYNGKFPGPTWVARTGDRVTTTLHNGLDEPTIVHWHGMVVDEANDGGPRSTIGPGQSYAYDFPIIQRAGLNFYHAHPDMLTGKQVARSAGASIVRGMTKTRVALLGRC